MPDDRPSASVRLNEELRQQAYEKIGRAVVLYQKYEALLKLLAVNQDLSGPLKDLPQIAAAKSAQVSIQSMGVLVEQVHKSLYSQSEGLPGSPEQHEHITVSMRFRIESSSEEAAARKQALRQLVKARNELIHQRLAKFDPSSAESCRDLIVDMDQQWEQLRAEFVALRSIVDALIDGRKEALDQVLRQMGTEPPAEKL